MYRKFNHSLIYMIIPAVYISLQLKCNLSQFLTLMQGCGGVDMSRLDQARWDPRLVKQVVSNAWTSGYDNFSFLFTLTNLDT